MRPTEAVDQKKSYVKPQLVTHGDVAKLTEGGHKIGPTPPDSGSNLRLPPAGPFGGIKW